MQFLEFYIESINSIRFIKVHLYLVSLASINPAISSLTSQFQFRLTDIERNFKVWFIHSSIRNRLPTLWKYFFRRYIYPNKASISTRVVPRNQDFHPRLFNSIVLSSRMPRFEDEISSKVVWKEPRDRNRIIHNVYKCSNSEKEERKKRGD